MQYTTILRAPQESLGDDGVQEWLKARAAKRAEAAVEGAEAAGAKAGGRPKA